MHRQFKHCRPPATAFRHAAGAAIECKAVLQSHAAEGCEICGHAYIIEVCSVTGIGMTQREHCMFQLHGRHQCQASFMCSE